VKTLIAVSDSLNYCVAAFVMLFGVLGLFYFAKNGFMSIRNYLKANLFICMLIETLCRNFISASRKVIVACSVAI